MVLGYATAYGNWAMAGNGVLFAVAACAFILFVWGKRYISATFSFIGAILLMRLFFFMLTPYYEFPEIHNETRDEWERGYYTGALIVEICAAACMLVAAFHGRRQLERQWAARREANARRERSAAPAPLEVPPFNEAPLRPRGASVRVPPPVRDDTDSESGRTF